MALTIEYRRRIERWITELERHMFRPIISVELAFCESYDFIHYRERMNCSYTPIKPGDLWGEPWSYGYFLGTFQFSSKDLSHDMFSGLPLVLRPDTGTESLVYINGHASGTRDQFHYYVPLPRPDAQHSGSISYEVFIESYAGHGQRNGHVGPNPRGTVTVPVPTGKQAVLGATEAGFYLEPLFQLWIEVSALLDVRDALEPDSLRQVEIDAGLRRFTHVMEFEEGDAVMLETASKARGELASLLEKTNGSTAAVLYMIGHSHLDIAWKWPISETRRKIARTMANQLSLLDSYPEYLFLFPQPFLYKLLQDSYPDIYSRVKQEVRRGRIIADGGMYVESDTNIPSGESLIRQFLYGKAFFRDELGCESRICWLPDAFGYSASLPQIMVGCGIKGFTTSKILWSYNGGDPFPYITFYWQGADGSRILAHNHNEYNAHSRPAFVINAWKSMQQKDGLRSRIMPFGYGDGGGGALRDHLEFLRREQDLEGMPRTRIAAPEKFFEDVEHDIKGGYADLPVYVGELYLQVHRGVLTTQSKTKKGNRMGETALRELEWWTALGYCQGVFDETEYASLHQETRSLWNTLLVNHFHDILPGTSIQRVHEEAESDFKHIIRRSGEYLAAVQQRLAENQGDADGNEADAGVFNSLSWGRDVLTQLPEGISVPGDIPVQCIDSRSYVLAALPPCGYVDILQGARDYLEREEGRTSQVLCRASDDFLENDCIKVSLNRRGEVTQVIDVKTGEVMVGSRGNVFRMYRDVPTMFDAWDIESMYHENPVELSGDARIVPISQGPLAAAVRITRKLHDSMLTQTVLLRKGSRRVDFMTVIDWKETHKLLKVEFDTGIHCDQALHNIQYGYTSRPNHHSRPYDSDRFEVCAQRWSALTDNSRGVSLLNDCKYGVSVRQSVISLSLLRSPLAPDMQADRGIQECTFSLYAWKGSLASSGLARQAYELQIPVNAVSPFRTGKRSYAYIEEENIILDTIKVCEKPGLSCGKNMVVFRLYDMLNCASRVRVWISMAAGKAFEASMDEQVLAEVSVGYDRERKKHFIDMDVGCFQVKTLMVEVR